MNNFLIKQKIFTSYTDLKNIISDIYPDFINIIGIENTIIYNLYTKLLIYRYISRQHTNKVDYIICKLLGLISNPDINTLKILEDKFNDINTLHYDILNIYIEDSSTVTINELLIYLYSETNYLFLNINIGNKLNIIIDKVRSTINLNNDIKLIDSNSYKYDIITKIPFYLYENLFKSDTISSIYIIYICNSSEDLQLHFLEEFLVYRNITNIICLNQVKIINFKLNTQIIIPYTNFTVRFNSVYIRLIPNYILESNVVFDKNRSLNWNNIGLQGINHFYSYVNNMFEFDEYNTDRQKIADQLKINNTYKDFITYLNSF